jgi:transposase
MAEKILISKAEYEALIQDKAELLQRNTLLKFQMEQLQKALFGRKSERFVPKPGGDPNQLTFNFGGESLTVEAEQTIRQAIEAHERQKPVQKQAHPGRLPIPEHLRREEEVIEPEEDTTDLVCIGQDVTETIEYTAADIYVKRVIRPKYARSNVSEEQTAIVQASAVETPFAKTKAGASLIAHILVNKYVDHLPLDRQLHRFARQGLKIPDSTMSDWVKKGASFLDTLYQAYRQWIFESDYLQMDETPIKVMEDAKGKCHIGYFWVVYDPVTRSPFYYYHPSRSQEAPKQLLERFAGTLQCDGYAVYETLKKSHEHGLTLVNCLAHIRRYFVEALNNDAERCQEAISLIKAMYGVEDQARNLQLEASQRLEYRQQHLKPLFEAFEQWLNLHIYQVTPASPIGKAAAYAKTHWPNMQAVLLDGRIEIDNNLVENIIRPVALGRKNYLFLGNHESGKRTACVYSFFLACKQYNINPETWMTDVFNRMLDTKTNNMRDLFPQYWKPQNS